MNKQQWGGWRALINKNGQIFSICLLSMTQHGISMFQQTLVFPIRLRA